HARRHGGGCLAHRAAGARRLGRREGQVSRLRFRQRRAGGGRCASCAGWSGLARDRRRSGWIEAAMNGGDENNSAKKSGRAWSPAMDHAVETPIVCVVMGVSGSGKTTIAALLAAALGCRFQEGDDFHPAANVAKMRSGTPLTDADRIPWLQRIAGQIDQWRAEGESGVITCSGLKRSYRDIVVGNRAGVV